MSARDLTRSVPFQLTRAEDDEAGDGLTLEGHAAVFGVPTRIDSWEGTFDEQIRKGAFRKTIRERTPVMQFDHGRHPLIGSIPLGVISDIREDDEGLFVQARLTDNWLIEPIRGAIADGAVDGMSFRFEVVREEWRDNKGKLLKDDSEILQLLYRPDDRGPLQRTLIEVRVPELGPVVFPAYQETSVDVRARSIASMIRDDEELKRIIRGLLAEGVKAQTEPDDDPTHPDLSDPELRRDVARVLLFDETPERSDDAPPEDEGHPSTEEDRSDDAPPADGHPSDDDDAPPILGHPSMSRSRMDAELALLTGHIDAAERYEAQSMRRQLP